MSGEREPRSLEHQVFSGDEFLDVYGRPTAGIEVNSFNDFLYSSLGMVNDYYGLEDMYANNAALPDRLRNRLYTTLYPGSQGRELYSIARADARVISLLHYMAFYRDFKRTENLGSDREKFDKLVFGIGSDTDVEQYLDYAHLPGSRSIDDTPVYKQRIEGGMPKAMRLLVAAQSLAQLSFERGYREKSAYALSRVPDLWRFSELETRSAINAAAEFCKEGLFSIVTADRQLAHKYILESDSDSIELLGGEDKLIKTATRAFRQFVEANGKVDNPQTREWLDMAAIVPSIGVLFPLDSRRTIAREVFLKKPRIPSDNLLDYIPRSEAAHLSRVYIEKAAAQPDDGKSGKLGLHYVATALKLPQDVFDGLVYEEYKEEFQVIHKCMPDRYAEILKSFAVKYRAAHNWLDKELIDLAKAYRRVINSGDLYWPIQGWSGAEGEEEFAMELGAKRDKAMRKLEELEGQIRRQVSGLVES